MGAMRWSLVGISPAMALGRRKSERHDPRESMKPPVKSGLRALAACIAALTIAGCDSHEEHVAEMKSNVPLKLYESGIYVAKLTGTAIYWLDNDRVIFAGNGERKPEKRAQYKRLESQLYIWRPGKPAKEYPVKRWEAKSWYPYYCAEAGRIFYGGQWVNEDPAQGLTFQNWYAGPPGQEKLENRPQPLASGIEHSQLPRRHIYYRSGRNRCIRVPDPRMYGRVWVQDADGSHYLDLHEFIGVSAIDPDTAKTWRFHLVDTKLWQRTPLPITRYNSESSCIAHDPANQRFLIWSCPADLGYEWPADQCLKFWLIDEATAKVRADCIPAGPWSGHNRYFNRIFSSAAGIFFIAKPGDDVKDDRDYGAAGLYRFQKGKVARVIPGYFRHPVLSPDTCKLAFFHKWAADDVRLTNEILPSVKVVDLCTDLKGK